VFVASNDNMADARCMLNT